MGGNDGLVHESFGFDISQALHDGRYDEALRGGEKIFYFMPGMRYLKALEDMLFGDTNFGVLLCTMLVPIFLYFILRRLFPLRWSVSLIVIFLFTPLLERLGFAQYLYVKEMIKGFPEPLGYGAFLGALALIAWSVPMPDAAPARSPMPGILIGLALALSVALRPNLAIAAAPSSRHARTLAAQRKTLNGDHRARAGLFSDPPDRLAQLVFRRPIRSFDLGRVRSCHFAHAALNLSRGAGRCAPARFFRRCGQACVASAMELESRGRLLSTDPALHGVLGPVLAALHHHSQGTCSCRALAPGLALLLRTERPLCLSRLASRLPRVLGGIPRVLPALARAELSGEPAETRSLASRARRARGSRIITLAQELNQVTAKMGFVT
jgi:hypothetical protein